ncbi:hypothetical protein RD792_012268 [Penstemon davidsonii]|uniref:Uncharacterized protein n=1 Tax=Penstemon davidsonii TaxID=160366 RepID=A0ABR0CWE7_9LAMI|nr:hypothetical protein RD792_012268 [Penstemon davidsonii]
MYAVLPSGPTLFRARVQSSIGSGLVSVNGHAISKIRARAKYLGFPLLGDDVYGGTKSMALSLLQSRNPSSSHGQLQQLVTRLHRPCLHALSLGYNHPFSQKPPPDFAEILDQLRNIGMNKIAGVKCEDMNTERTL